MKGIRAALCFHSALHSALMLFFPWPLLPCAREEFDKVTSGPRYLFLSLHLPSLSQILIVCLAGLDCLSSHQWGHTFGLPSLSLHQHLHCHLFYCWSGQRTDGSDSISYMLRLMYRTEPSPPTTLHAGMKRVQGFTAGRWSAPCLATSCSPLILCSFLIEPEPSGRIFLRHTLLKHTSVSRGIALWQNTVSFDFSSASLCDLLQPKLICTTT